jgi:UDP-3-O-[3-hydroxymyristoyl] N-acetylglucosamine deacetylase
LSVERQQNTIARPAKVSGFGYWSGLDVQVEFRPAPAGHGIVFVRRDLPGMPTIPAKIEYRVDGPRRTTLTCRSASVEMVEHLLAALAGLQIDNCQVWVDRAEMPGFDGSAKPFVEALTNAGVQALPARRPCLVVSGTVRVGDENSWISISPSSQGKCEICYELDYPNDPAIGHQTHSTVLGEQDFANGVAPARTFITQQEAEALRQQGLGRRVSYSDLLVFDQQGAIQNKLHFENECARHKLLDVIGDVSLVGCDLVGRIEAYRSGHRLNAELVRQLLNLYPQMVRTSKAA